MDPQPPAKNVVPIRPDTLPTDDRPPLRDVAVMLRRLADAIERGDYGEVGCCGVAVLGDRLSTFGFGPDSGSSSVACLFQAANIHLISGILEHGVEQ